MAALDIEAEVSGVAGLAAGISWYGPARFHPDHPGSDAVVQAAAGLMYLHGRDRGGPRRLGIEVPSVMAGVLAANAVVAGLVGARRGWRPRPIETSVLQAALMLASHQIAAATCEEEWVPAPVGPAPGPPFRSSDGEWFEMETLDPEAWRAFWAKIGAADEVGRGWTAFRSRYYRGTCTLPHGFHETTASRSLAEIQEVATACGVSVARVRPYAEALRDLPPSAGHPVVRPGPPVAASRLNSPDEPIGLDERDDTDQHGELPLSGIRVVEATTRMQGPLAGLLLRWLGADVVRVEPPGGDISRGVPPLAGDTGSFFLCFNRGKRPVEIDLGKLSGRAELRDLTATADVFLHNWRPGKAAEWGLEAEDLGGDHPRLVYSEASGWGSVRGRPQLVGTDFLVQAHAGLGHGLNPEGEEPLPSRVLLTDCMGAVVACEGVLHGLLRREQTGRGCRVETSLLAGAVALQAHVLDALAAGEECGRHQGRPRWGALDVPLRALDGHVAVTVDDAAALRRAADACGVDADNDPDAVERRIARHVGGRRAGECAAVLAAAGLPAAVVATDLAALPATPELAGLFEALAGPSRVPASPWRFDP